MWDIRLLLRKSREAIPYRAYGFAVDETRRWIADYQSNMERNRAALPEIVAWLEGYHRVAYWGAGRIFDALVRYGGLHNVSMLADGMLSGVVDKVHGIELCRPEELAAMEPNVVVVLARTSNDAMVEQARRYAPTVLTFNDLLDAALA